MFEVVPGVYRGPRPKSVAELRENKIERVLILESGFRDMFFEDRYETELATALDIHVSRVDMSGIWPPERHDVEQAVKIIADSLAENIRIMFHCMAGKDRTGFVAAVFAMNYRGMTYEQAVAEYKRMGLHYRYYWWLKELKKYDPSNIT